MPTLRVAYAIPAFLPARAYGGPVETVFGLAEGTHPLGVEAVVYTSTLAGPGEASLPEGEAKVAGFRVHRMPTLFAVGWAPAVRWRQPREIPDVVHVLGAWNGLSYAAVHWAILRRIPWIWEPCGMLAPRGRRIALKVALTPYHIALAATCAGIIWKSPQERAEAPSALRLARVFMRPNPVASSPLSLPSRADARQAVSLPTAGPLWGYLGRIAHRKGLADLLAAWRRARGPGHLVVAGPVEDQALARELREAAHERVLLLEPLDRERRWLFLRALDALVLIPKFGENFGNVVAEAVAAGTPAVVSPAVGAGWWLKGHGAVVVNPPFDQLVEMFRAGTPPDVTPSMPPSLEPAAIAQAQMEIYRTVLQQVPYTSR